MLQIKALYNLLRKNALEDPSIEAPSWALEDFRELSIDDLWSRLNALDISLDRASLARFAEECDSPEELAELLVDEENDSVDCDYIYLLLFELWRRFLPDRPSLSIFCDDLDHQIDLYDKELLETDEDLQDVLSNLAEILEEHVDEGIPANEAFASVNSYCANDLESFLFDFIEELLDQGHNLYAAELFEEFEIYFADDLRIEWIHARLLEDVDEANQRIRSLLAQHPDVELLFSILSYLLTAGDHNLFQIAVQTILPKLESEEDIYEVMHLAADYYRRLDHEEVEQAIQSLIALPKPDLEAFQKLISSK